MKHRYLIWHPDGYLEFVNAKPCKSGGVGEAVLTSQTGIELARAVDDGNGVDFFFAGRNEGPGKKSVRLDYGQIDYIRSCVLAERLAGGRKDDAAEFYELVPQEDR